MKKIINIDNILNKANKATCGIMEKEVTVPSSQVEAVKKRLRNNGYMIIGTSEPGKATTKIWFIIRGGF